MSWQGGTGVFYCGTQKRRTGREGCMGSGICFSKDRMGNVYRSFGRDRDVLAWVMDGESEVGEARG